jgi:hypothetical protein
MFDFRMRPGTREAGDALEPLAYPQQVSHLMQSYWLNGLTRYLKKEGTGVRAVLLFGLADKQKGLKGSKHLRCGAFHVDKPIVYDLGLRSQNVSSYIALQRLYAIVNSPI